MKFYYRPQLLEIVIFFCDEPNYSDGQIKCFNLTFNTLSTFLLLLKYLPKKIANLDDFLYKRK